MNQNSFSRLASFFVLIIDFLRAIVRLDCFQSVFAMDTTAGAQLIDKTPSAIDCYILEAAYVVTAVLAISVAVVNVVVVIVVVAVVVDIQYQIEAFTKQVFH